MSQVPGARDHDGREVRHGPARRQDALRRAWEPDCLCQPAEHIGFQLDQAGRRQPHTGVPIDGIGNEVGNGAVQEPATGDVGQVAGACRVEARRHRAVEQKAQHVLEVLAVLGNWRNQGSGGFLCPVHVLGRLGCQGIDMGGDALEHRSHHGLQVGA